MDPLDLSIRRHVYRRFVELGRAPRADEVADEVGLEPAEVGGAFQRLHEAYAIVLEQDGLAIRMANPFSAVETPHAVAAGKPGATLTARKLSDLAYAWWGDRLAPDWEPRSREQAQAILDGLGLTEPFWQLD